MDADEERIGGFLADYGLAADRFQKSEIGSGKTPDFRVRRPDSEELLFYCEVKSIREDDFLDRRLDEAEPGELAGGARKDPIFNRLTDDIHQAVKQFAAVNAELARPNVLAFVNHDRMCGFLDLIGVLTGNFMAEGGRAIPSYRLYSEGRIKDEKASIHLFLWLDDFRPHRLLFGQTHEDHHLLLCECFRMEPAAIVQIRS